MRLSLDALVGLLRGVVLRPDVAGALLHLFRRRRGAGATLFHFPELLQHGPTGVRRLLFLRLAPLVQLQAAGAARPAAPERFAEAFRDANDGGRFAALEARPGPAVDAPATLA